MVSDGFLLQAPAAEKPSSSGASTSSSSSGGASKSPPKKEEIYRKDEGMRREKTEPNLQQNGASVKDDTLIDELIACGMMIAWPAKSAPRNIGQDSRSSIPGSLPINSMAHGSNTNTVGEEMPADDAPPELASPRVPVERDMLVSSAKKRKRMPSISVEDLDQLNDQRDCRNVCEW